MSYRPYESAFADLSTSASARSPPLRASEGGSLFTNTPHPGGRWSNRTNGEEFMNFARSLLSGRTNLGALGVAAVAAMLFALPSLCAAAPAVVVHDTGCGVFDASGNLVFLSEGAKLSVGTANTNSCNATINCKASISNPTKKTIKFDSTSTGLPCGTINGLTEDWQEVISASGQLSLVCHLKTCE